MPRLRGFGRTVSCLGSVSTADDLSTLKAVSHVDPLSPCDESFEVFRGASTDLPLDVKPRKVASAFTEPADSRVGHSNCCVAYANCKCVTIKAGLRYAVLSVRTRKRT